MGDPFRIGDGDLFQRQGVGDRNLFAGQTADRAVQVVKGFLLDLGDDLTRETAQLRGLLHNQHVMSLLG